MYVFNTNKKPWLVLLMQRVTLLKLYGATLGRKSISACMDQAKVADNLEMLGVRRFVCIEYK